MCRYGYDTLIVIYFYQMIQVKDMSVINSDKRTGIIEYALGCGIAFQQYAGEVGENNHPLFFGGVILKI